MSSKNGKVVDRALTPTYIDALDDVVVPNKVTLAPGDVDVPEVGYEGRERTLLLKPHTGEKGRKADEDLLEYFQQMQKSLGDDASDESAMKYFLNDKEKFFRMTAMTLDLSVEDIKQYTLFEIFGAFMSGMRYRSGDTARDAVQAAIKKFRAAHEEAMEGA